MAKAPAANALGDDTDQPPVLGTFPSKSSPAGLLFQFKDDKGKVYFTGDPDIDAVLIGAKWSTTQLTYSFPTSGSFYEGQGYEPVTMPSFHRVFNDQQKAAARYALDLVSSYTELTFKEITETATAHADMRFSQTTWSGETSAHAGFPSGLPDAGDVWFGTASEQPFYLTPAKGNWGMATMLHEIGHGLGLKHGHQDYSKEDLSGYLGVPKGNPPRYGTDKLPDHHDGQDWSLMSYRSDPSSSSDDKGEPQFFEGDGFNQPQTYMQNDITALQFLYGANFKTNGGNTVYRWNPQTGEMSIGGVGQGRPTANKISMTLWDGNGVDTYDLSNYTTNLKLNLLPGAFSTFSVTQLVDHRPISDGKALAVGNVANALLYDEDTRSLIENAIGGRGNDRITGNDGDNTLDGRGGIDKMKGLDGNDIYVVDNARDTVLESAGGGHDTVMTSVSYTLAEGQEIEWLQLRYRTGEAKLDLTGNGSSQTIIGNDGANRIDGKLGADVLTGKDGADTFVFSTKLGADLMTTLPIVGPIFGVANVDHITDFSREDQIQLARSIFKALAPGELKAAAFKEIGKAGVKLDADDRILYDRKSGDLFYDADGSGKIEKVKFAVLDNKAPIDHTDFFVV